MSNDATMPHHSRGQIWSIDLLSGLALVMLLMLLFILQWNQFTLRWNNALSYRTLLSSALFASDALFLTPGDPPAWESYGNASSNGVLTLGLAYSRNSLDNRKLALLGQANQSEADYQKVLSKLGLEGSQMSLIISDLGGDITYYSFGRPSGLNNSAVIDRMVMFNGTTARARVEVWR